GKVPHQRRHERRVLADQVGLVDAVGKTGGPLPGADQPGRDLLAQRAGVGGDGHDCPSRWAMLSRMSSAGQRLRSASLPAKSSTAILAASGAPALASAAAAASKHRCAALASTG